MKLDVREPMRSIDCQRDRSASAPSIVGPGESQSSDADTEPGGVIGEGQPQPVVMATSCRAEVPREYGHSMAEGDMGELAGVAGRHPDP